MPLERNVWSSGAGRPTPLRGKWWKKSRDPVREPPPDPSAARLCGRQIWYQAHLQNLGWQVPVCNGEVAGLIDGGLRLEALAIMVLGTGGLWARALSDGLGWSQWQQVADGTFAVVGTTGRSREMTSLELALGDGEIRASAHQRGIGWEKECRAVAGSTLAIGVQDTLSMDAVRFTVH